MLKLFRRALDAERLANELERAERRIKDLEGQLSKAHSAPSFVAVAKSFNVSDLHEEVRQRVVADFSPILERSALQMLKQAMSSIARDQRQPMTMLAAYDYRASVYHLRFDVPAMGTTMQLVK